MRFSRRHESNRSPGRAKLRRTSADRASADRSTAAGGDSPQPAARKRKTSFTGRAAVLAVVLAALVIALAGPLRQLISQRAQISSLQSDVERQTQQLKSLQQQQKQWADPSYVAQQARDRLHYVLPGQVPYVTLAPTPSATASSGAAADDDAPWYAQLWSSIQGADATAKPSANPTANPSATPQPTPAPPSAPSP